MSVKQTGSECYRFRREEHLKGRTPIRKVFDKGKRFYLQRSNELSACSYSIKLFVLKNDMPYNRVCFTCSGGRKFGNAVKRNRAKRVVREVYRLIKSNLAGGYDLILLIRKNENERKGALRRNALSEMTEQLLNLFKKAGLLEK